MTQLLILLAPAPHWLRLVGETVVARGDGWPAPDPDADIVLAVPSEAVGLTWHELPALAPAQAVAAARSLIAETVAPPPEGLHVAVGAGTGRRPIAWVAPQQLAAWLAEAAAHGLEPRHVVPDALLLPVPDGEMVHVWTDGDRQLARGTDLALAGEAALVDLLIGDRPRQALTSWQHGLAARLVAPAVDLRAGAFARRQGWQGGAWPWRRLAGLAAAAALLGLAGDVAHWLRASLAADRLEQQLVEDSRAVLPRGTVVTAATAVPLLRDRATALGAGGGFAAATATLLGGLATQPQAALTRLDYGAGGGLAATLAEGDRDLLLASLGPQASAGGPNEVRVTPR